MGNRLTCRVLNGVQEIESPFCSKHTLTFAFLIFIVLCLFSPIHLSAAVNSATVKSYQNKIAVHTNRADSLKQLIEAGEKRIQKLRQDEKSTLRQLDEMEANMMLANRLLAELTNQAIQVEKDMKSAQRAAEQAGVQLQSRQHIMEQRLRQIYKTGKVTLPALLLGAATPTEFLNRVRFAADLNRYDRQIIAKIGEEKVKRNTELTLLQMQNRHFAELKKQKEQETVQLAIQKQQREKLVAEIRSEKSEWLAQLEELKAAQRKLNAIVENLIRQRDASESQAGEQTKPLATGFSKNRGSLPWPITGKIISPYGKQTHPVYGTVITNKGIGIAGTPGQSVRAVASGSVEYSGSLPGYGKVVIVNHGNGFMTIYAHLGTTSVSKGAETLAGTILGTVGASEGISATQLHFEIRQKTETENPLLWLRK